MKLSKLLLLSFASSAMTLATQAATVNLPNTGASGTVGSADANWDVYRFANTVVAADLNTATPYVTAINSSTLGSEVATARDSNPYATSLGNIWITPGAGATWLSVNANVAGTPLSDPNIVSTTSGGTPRYGGSYAFVLNIGSSLSAAAAALSTPEVVNFAQPVSLSFNLNADNQVSAFLVSKPTATGSYSQSAALLAPTNGLFGGPGSIAVNAPSAYVNPYTQLVILLSNTPTTSTPNLGGILVQSFSATYTAIPEPSTYAAILGAATLGIAVWVRRKRA